MALSALNTMSAAEIAAAVKRSDFTTRSPFLDPDPWPLYVRYEADRAVYVPRDRYYFNTPAGPSACLWIVPGSTR
jgi:hypothetical protein